MNFKLNLTAAGPGTARVFLYDVDPIDGNKSYTRVWNTSCTPVTNPAPDYGLSACAAADGTTPPWAPDMMGGILASRRSPARPRARARSRSRSSAAALSQDGEGASVLVSFVTPRTRCRRSTCRSRRVTGGVGGTVPATLSLTLGHAGGFGAFTPGVRADYFATTAANVISTAGDAALSVAIRARLAPAGSSTARSRWPRRFRPASAAPTRRSAVEQPHDDQDVERPGLQRRGGDRLQAVDRGQRAAATGTYSKTLTFTLSTTNP